MVNRYLDWEVLLLRSKIKFKCGKIQYVVYKDIFKDGVINNPNNRNNKNCNLFKGKILHKNRSKLKMKGAF